MEEEKTVLVPESILLCTHRVGFFRHVRKLSAECESMIEAYERAEKALEDYGMARRYSNYNSFRKQYWLWIKEQIASEIKG